MISDSKAYPPGAYPPGGVVSKSERDDTRDSLPKQAARLRSVDALIVAGLAAEPTRDSLEAVARRYAIAITPEMAALIDPKNPRDPIALQFVPRPAELVVGPDELTDPIGDAAH